MRVEESVIVLTVATFLLVVFLASVALAVRGAAQARYFLWAWALLLLVFLPFSTQASIFSGMPAALILFFFFYIIILGKLHSNEQLEVSHEETRRVLAESNRRIDEERRQISRTLHDVVNPNLAFSITELSRLEKLVAGDTAAEERVAALSTLISSAYKNIRDIIKNTRIELIDSIGFTAAVESLISHYSNVLEKPVIELDHDLPKRPDIDEEQAVAAFRIIREAIFNAVKHSQAKNVLVKIRWNERQQQAYVAISDDGVGLPANKAGIGIGLIDMRERARAMGSVFKMGPDNARNRNRPGTKISFSFSGRSLSDRNV